MKAPNSRTVLPTIETIWFAETIEKPTRYYVMGVPGTPAHLTESPREATRLSSKAQCLDVCHGVYASVKGWKLRAVEHSFFSDDVIRDARLRLKPRAKAPGKRRANVGKGHRPNAIRPNKRFTDRPGKSGYAGRKKKEAAARRAALAAAEVKNG